MQSIFIFHRVRQSALARLRHWSASLCPSHAPSHLWNELNVRQPTCPKHIIHLIHECNACKRGECMRALGTRRLHATSKKGQTNANKVSFIWSHVVMHTICSTNELSRARVSLAGTALTTGYTQHTTQYVRHTIKWAQSICTQSQPMGERIVDHSQPASQPVDGTETFESIVFVKVVCFWLIFKHENGYSRKVQAKWQMTNVTVPSYRFLVFEFVYSHVQLQRASWQVGWLAGSFLFLSISIRIVRISNIAFT